MNNYLNLKIRISKDNCGTDRCTKEEILSAMKSGDITMGGGCNPSSIFLMDKTTGKILGVVE